MQIVEQCGVDAQQGVTNGGSYSVDGCDSQSGADVYGDVHKLPHNQKTENWNSSEMLDQKKT